MIRRTMAAMLFLALLFVQGAVEQCHIRCAMPMAAMAMGSVPADMTACDGMDMADSSAVAHQASSCEQHGCQAASLDAVIEDHAATTSGAVEVSSLLPVLLWPDGMRLAEPSTGPPGRQAESAPPLDDVGSRLTDSLRV